MIKNNNIPLRQLAISLSITLCISVQAWAQSATSAVIVPKDPGIRPGNVGAGGQIKGSEAYTEMFNLGKEKFLIRDHVKGEENAGLGPTYNLDSCEGCHTAPAIGGSSPIPKNPGDKPINPQYSFWSSHPELQKSNKIPSFIKGNDPAHPGFTPIREARFVKEAGNPNAADGGVHGLFTIVGLTGAETCTKLPQPDFEMAVAERNVIFRIPTPLYGAGLIESISDAAIAKNLQDSLKYTKEYGISGKINLVVSGRTRINPEAANHNGNDGTIARFGWKAQNKSLLLFAGEAYNVEMGISNELFPTERDETPGCQLAATPNDATNLPDDQHKGLKVLSDIELFAGYMRLLAPPEPALDQPGGADSIKKGRSWFRDVGCSHCHTPEFITGNSAIDALKNKPVKLYSDLLLHNMGPKLADGISQGQAGPDEFRTAPLWGLGKRSWFLHDGRTNDLLVAIKEHESDNGLPQSYAGMAPIAASEANISIRKFNQLSAEQQQDLLNFLRSL